MATSDRTLHGKTTSTSTLTSLAILKVNIDQGRDYLEYLVPFVLQVLFERKPDLIKSGPISDCIGEMFGLSIPERTVEIVLKRISRRIPAIKKENHVYRIIDKLPDPRITAKQHAMEECIEKVLTGLQKFSEDRNRPIRDKKHAAAAICAFLARFDIICLRAYLQRTVIPPVEEVRDTDTVLVGDYIQHVQRTDSQQFEDFVKLVQGNMLANALLCPDLDYVSASYRNVTFYLDTPVIIQWLDLEAKAKYRLLRDLIELLVRLKGRVAVFTHTLQEVRQVIVGAANHLCSPNIQSPIVREARRRGTTRSDLLLLAESIEDRLREYGIVVEDTPLYQNSFQIDEGTFEQILDTEVSYVNPRAKENDINSVRSIYSIRRGRSAPSLEKSEAVLVTSNTAFVRAAWEYGKQHESSRDVSPVFSDFILANLAWLKAPMGAASIPRAQLLSLCYAALEPSPELLARILTEIDRLEDQGTVEPRQLQLLRGSPAVYSEVIRVTLGDDASLSRETLTETVDRVTKEIKRDESAKLIEEMKAHAATREQLQHSIDSKDRILMGVYWQCRRRAKAYAICSSALVAFMLMVGLVAGSTLHFGKSLSQSLFGAGVVVLAIVTFSNLLTGFNVSRLFRWAENRCLNWLLIRRAGEMGVDLSAFDMSG